MLFKGQCQLISERGDKHENDYVAGTSVIQPKWNSSYEPDLQRQNSEWMRNLLTERQTHIQSMAKELAHPVKTLKTSIIIALSNASIIIALMQFSYNSQLIISIEGQKLPTAEFHFSVTWVTESNILTKKRNYRLIMKWISCHMKWPHIRNKQLGQGQKQPWAANTAQLS